MVHTASIYPSSDILVLLDQPVERSPGIVVTVGPFAQKPLDEIDPAIEVYWTIGSTNSVKLGCTIRSYSAFENKATHKYL